MPARIGLGGRIVRNSTYLFAANTAAKLLAFVLNAIIIWHVGQEVFGAYRWTVAYVGIWANLVELGMLRVGMRAIARSPSQAPAVFRGFFRSKIALSAMTAVPLVVVTEFLLTGVDDYRLVRVLSYIWYLVVVVHVMRKNHEAVFLGLERMGWVALFVVSNRFFTLLFAWLYFGHSSSLVILFAIFLCIDLGDLGLQALALRHVFRRHLGRIVEEHREADRDTQTDSPEEDYTERGVFGWIRESLPFGLQELSGEVYMRIDSVMIGWFLTQGFVGVYNQAYLILTAVLVLPNAICQALFPSLSAMYRRSPGEMRAYFRRQYVIIFSIGPYLMAGLVMFGPLFLHFLRGFSMDVVWIYLVAMLTLPVYFLTMPLTYYLAATFKQGLVTGVSVAMALFNVGVNWILIPRLGPLGAAIATLATELLALTLFAGYLQARAKGLFDAGWLLRVVGLHALLFIPGCYIYDLGWIARIAYLAIYGGVLAGVILHLRFKAKAEFEGSEGLHA